MMEQRRVDSLGPRSPLVGEVLVQPDGRACLENVSWRDPALGKRAGHEQLARVTGISSVGLGPLFVAPQGGSVSRFGEVCHEAGGREFLDNIAPTRAAFEREITPRRQLRQPGPEALPVRWGILPRQSSPVAWSQ